MEAKSPDLVKSRSSGGTTHPQKESPTASYGLPLDLELERKVNRSSIPEEMPSTSRMVTQPVVMGLQLDLHKVERGSEKLTMKVSKGIAKRRMRIFIKRVNLILMT
jgi:hypothetical protein